MMEMSITTTIIAVAAVQLLGIILFILKANRDVRAEITGLNERVEKQTANLANLNGMIVTHQQGLVSLNEMVQAHQQSLENMLQTIELHQKNLSAMEKRIVEVEKVGDLFKNLFDEIPVAIDKYNKIMDKMHEESSSELEKARKNRDHELILYQEKELESVEVRRKLISELPVLMNKLGEALSPVNERLKLFSGRDKYPTGSILSYPARRAKALLTAIGEQSGPRVAAKSSVRVDEKPTPNGNVIIARQESKPESSNETTTLKNTRRRKKESEENR